MTAANQPARKPARDRSVLWSAAGHGLLLVVILVGGLSLPHKPPQTQLAIRATVVEQPGKARPKVLKAPEAPPQPEPKPRTEPRPEPKPEPRPEPKPEPKPPPKPQPKPEPKPEAKAPPPKVDPKVEQRKAEQKQRDVEKAAKLEREKQQAAEQKAEAERAKAEAEKQKAARDKAEAERRQAAKEAADLERQLEEEERLQAASDSGALAAYQNMLRQRVERNWVRPPGARDGIECEVLVTQIPGGQVTGVQTGRCNADEAVRRSIEAAVLRASPLPPPDDAALFDRNLRFTFKPEQ